MKAEIKDNFLDGAGLVVLVSLILAKRCAQLGGDSHFTFLATFIPEFQI
jgi:hypothetical protein